MHQILFQGMFSAKNMALNRKLDAPIRGRNRAANLAIGFFGLFIAASGLIAWLEPPFGTINFIGKTPAMAVAVLLLALNLLLGAASLIGLEDSWRVGVIRQQQTALIESGVYRFSRNPYFVSYLMMFAAYTILLRSLILFALLPAAIAMTHAMVVVEEKHLDALHGDRYRRYQDKVPRYLII